ncbi:MAG: hypothetical protein HDT47_02915 [Ruminococcaceae bacterium]|nr:hypothetical protein [Oscillospiraceae bacterium]
MIIFENHTYQITGGCPNKNYLEGLNCEQPKWVVDDNSELARKILSSACWKPVEDEKGNLIDIVIVDVPEHEPTAEEKTGELKAQLDEIDRLAIRPLRAIAAGTATDEDRETLAELEKQAEEIRMELAELSEEKAVVNNG